MRVFLGFQLAGVALLLFLVMMIAGCAGMTTCQKAQATLGSIQIAAEKAPPSDYDKHRWMLEAAQAIVDLNCGVPNEATPAPSAPFAQ